MNPAENNCHLFAPETPSKEGDEDGDGDSTSPIIEEVTVIPYCTVMRFDKKCSPEKVSIKKHLQIDTLPTQKMEFIHHEQQKWVFWQMQKSRFLILEIKSHISKNSTIFNIL